MGKRAVVKLEKFFIIQGKILRVIHNFLHARKVQLKINSHLGYACLCGWFGLQQGSVLSPRQFATKIIVLSFEDLMVFVISNQSGSCGSCGLCPQTPAYQNNNYVNVVMALKSLIFLLRN